MLTKEQRKQTFELAVDRTGVDSQIDKTCTEMAEFIHAALETRACGVTYSWAFFEEMGHVQLCLELIESRLKDFPSDGYGTCLKQVDTIREKRMKDWYEFEVEEGKKRKLKKRSD